MEKHPEILRPTSREYGISQEEIDRSALQDSYLDTLTRLGLLQQRNKSFKVTTLGRLLLRYILDKGPYDDPGTAQT
jgi:hypothetical protein